MKLRVPLLVGAAIMAYTIAAWNNGSWSAVAAVLCSAVTVVLTQQLCRYFLDNERLQLGLFVPATLLSLVIIVQLAFVAGIGSKPDPMMSLSAPAMTDWSFLYVALLGLAMLELRIEKKRKTVV